MSVNPGFGGQTFIPRSESKVRAVRALLDAAGQRRADRSRRRHRPSTNIGARRRRRRPHPRGRLGDLRYADPEQATRELKAAAARCAPCEPPGEPPLEFRPRDFPRPGPLRRNRQDGRGLLRELLRLVRGRPHRPAARAGWSYREMEADGFALPVDRSALRLPAVGAIRRRAGDSAPADHWCRRCACGSTYEVVRPSGRSAGCHGPTVHAALDRAGRPCRLPPRRTGGSA